MKLKRNTGLVLSLVLILAPATAAVAKPVASHHLVISWSSMEAGTSVNGSIDFVIDESGTPMIDLIRTESRFEACADGSGGVWSSSTEYRGSAALSVTIDRHLQTVEIVGDLPARQRVTSSCGSSAVVESTSLVFVSLTGLSDSRSVRTRDSDSRSRIISRWHSFVLELDGDLVSSQGMLTKTISRA